jgi:hypothetical protein
LIQLYDDALVLSQQRTFYAYSAIANATASVWNDLWLLTVLAVTSMRRRGGRILKSDHASWLAVSCDPNHLMYIDAFSPSIDSLINQLFQPSTSCVQDRSLRDSTQQPRRVATVSSYPHQNHQIKSRRRHPRRDRPAERSSHAQATAGPERTETNPLCAMPQFL